MNQQPLLANDVPQDETEIRLSEQQQIQQQLIDDEDEEEQNKKYCWESFKEHSGMHYQLAKNHFGGFYLTNFGMSVGTAVFSTILPIALRQDGQTDSTIGMIVALNGVGRFVAEVPISLMSLKFGPWLTSLVALIALTLSYLVPTVWLTKWSWIVAMAVGGVATAGFATPRHELLQQGFKKAERSRVSGHMGMIGRISYLVAPASSGAIYQHIGPSYALLFGIFFLLITLGAVFSDELIQLDEVLRKKHEEELAKKRRKEEMKKQERLGVVDTQLFVSESNDDVSDLDDQHAPSEMETESNASMSNASFASTASLGAPNPSQFPMRAAAMYLNRTGGNNNEESHRNKNNKNRVTASTVAEPMNSSADAAGTKKNAAADEEHHTSVWEALKQHWRTVLGVGLLVLTIMSLRQARRLTITLRALNLNFNARDVGLILAGSFVVDTIFFWVSSTVVNKYGYLFAIGPLLFFYGCAFAVEAIEPANGSPVTLFMSLPIFGVGDSFGAGIVLSVISELCPRALVGVTRLWLDFGVLVGPIVTGWIAHSVSLSACCLVLCGWSAVGIVLAFFLLRGGVGRHDK